MTFLYEDRSYNLKKICNHDHNLFYPKFSNKIILFAFIWAGIFANKLRKSECGI